jgi:glycosyltransferase involved in cell wall biosynthesis
MSFNNSSVPSLSVVIPTYNRSSDLARCLNSLVLQTRIDFEVLICDDGSTDCTFQVFAEFACRLNIKFLPGANSGGPATPRNRGLRMSSALFVAFLDSDDWWHPLMVELSLACLEKGGDIVYSNGYICSPSREIIGRVNSRSLRGKDVYYDLLIRGNTLTTSSVFVRRSCFHDIGLFNESPLYQAWEDYDMWLRLARGGFKFRLIPKRLVFYSISDDSISVKRSSLVLHAISRCVYGTNEPFESAFSSPLPAWFYYQSGLLSSSVAARKAIFFYIIAIIKSVSPPQPILLAKILVRIFKLVLSRFLTALF